MKGTTFTDDTRSVILTYYHRDSAVASVGEGISCPAVEIAATITLEASPPFWDAMGGKMAMAELAICGDGTIIYALWPARQNG